MNIDVYIKDRMKRSGWGHRRNYFYKRIKDRELVMELHGDNIFVDVFDRKTFASLGRQICKTFAEALAKSLMLEKNFSGRSYSKPKTN